MPAVVEGSPTLGSSSKVAIVRAVVSLYRSSPTKEVSGGLKRKNSHLPQETTNVAVESIEKKRRLVKEFELVFCWKETSSSLPLRKPSSDKVSKGKNKGSSSQEVVGDLPITLISNELRVHFQLSPDSSPTSIAELLSNHAFGMPPNLADSRLVGTIC